MPDVTVALGETKTIVGRLRFTRSGDRQFSSFVYAESWLRHPHRFALAPDLALDEVEKYARGRDDPRDALHGAFADAAPDAWGRRLLTRLHGNGLDEFDFLRLAADRTRQGAIRFLDASGGALSEDPNGVPRLVALDELRRIAAVVERDPNEAGEQLSRLAGAAASLGGARPKANILAEDGLWIAKFTSALDTHPVERVEVATLKLAAACGLRTPATRLEFATTAAPVALFKRFDRNPAGRIPYLSARTALGVTGSGLASYTEIGDVIRRIGYDVPGELRELYRRMVFTILVTNKDDHLKNHGFLYVGSGRWRLSPAFDINPAPERERRLETAILEGGGHDASIALALEAAPFFDLSLPEATGLVHGMARTIQARWQEHLRAERVSRAELDRYETAFAHAEMARALALTSA